MSFEYLQVSPEKNDFSILFTVTSLPEEVTSTNPSNVLGGRVMIWSSLMGFSENPFIYLIILKSDPYTSRVLSSSAATKYV